MKFKNNSIFLQMRHHLDVSIAIKLSQIRQGALFIATTARYVFGQNM
jgi:Tfp pilus assembly protein PilZ